MGDFIKAALPWVAVGIAIIILAISANRKKSTKIAQAKTQKGSEQETDNYMKEGLSIGMCLGSVLGATHVVNIGTGIGLGMLIGILIGRKIKK